MFLLLKAKAKRSNNSSAEAEGAGNVEVGVEIAEGKIVTQNGKSELFKSVESPKQ